MNLKGFVVQKERSEDTWGVSYTRTNGCQARLLLTIQKSRNYILCTECQRYTEDAVCRRCFIKKRGGKMSREHPILFKPEMVRATLKNLKTQTRRVILQNNHKPPTGKFVHFLDSLGYPASEGKLWAGFGNPEDPVYVKCPYGIVGDRLYVRETWWDLGHNENGKWEGRTEAHTVKPRYVATCPDPFAEGIGGVAEPKRIPWRKALLYHCTWRKRPSIFMPKWVARIWLEITNIRVERVQDIDAVEAEAEGMRRPKRLCPDRHDEYILERFIRLWDSLNAKRWQRWRDEEGNWHRTFVDYGWDKNPWVWVIEFKKVGE